MPMQYVLLCVIKNRTDQELTVAYRTLLGKAKATWLEVRKYVLDNACCNAMKGLMRSECMLELVPPHCHRRNIAETAIKNFKNHFISISCSRTRSKLSLQCVGQTTPTNWTDIKSAQTIKYSPHHLCPSPLVWKFWFQQNDTCTNGICSADPWGI